MAPPDHLYSDWRGVSQRPEDDTVTPVLGRGPFGSDRFGHQIVYGGEHLPGLGQGVHPGRGRGDGPAGAVQQPDAEDLLEGHEVP